MVKDLGQSLPKLPADLPKDAQHETANLVHSAAVRLLRTARAADTDLDLDGPRASLLSVLVFAGPQPVTKLADLEQVSAPAITKMVGALESAGLAQRERSETDRRVVLVSATPAGKRLLERGRGETDPAAVKKTYQDFNKAMAKGIYSLPIWYVDWAIGYQPDVKLTFPPLPDGAGKPLFLYGRIPVLGLSKG